MKIAQFFLWKYFERSSVQVAQFVISVILARLLEPNDFGILAIVMVFIGFANFFVKNGLVFSLVQKKETLDLDFSTMFWFLLLTAVVIYTILFFIAPLIVIFYANEKLILIIRVLGLTVIFGALSSVQESYIQKKFLFKKLFFISLAVVVLSGFLGIYLAFFGFGIWALVWQQISSVFLMCVFMLFMISWKPSFYFSFVNAKKLLNFGYKVLISHLLDFVYINSINLLIGKFYSTTILGFYNMGEKFPQTVVGNVNDSIGAVIFPTLSNVQDDIEQFKQIMRRGLLTSCFILFPLMALLASTAAQTVNFILGEKWLPCVIFLQISCFIFSLWPIHTTNLTSMNSLGRSDMYLKVAIINKIIGVSAIVIALIFFNTPLAIVLSQVIISLIGLFINTFPNKVFLNYGFLEQLKDILPAFVFSIFAGFSVYFLSLLSLPNLAVIILQIILGTAIYLLLAKIFNLESLYYFMDSLKNLTIKEQNKNY